MADRYTVSIFCRDCAMDEDEYGCFMGGSEWITRGDCDKKYTPQDDEPMEFSSFQEADEAGQKATEKVTPWDYIIYKNGEQMEDGVINA